MLTVSNKEQPLCPQKVNKTAPGSENIFFFFLVDCSAGVCWSVGCVQAPPRSRAEITVTGGEVILHH